MGRKSSTGYIGVYRDQSKVVRWKAEIIRGQRRIYVGTFPTIEEAVEARRQACLEHFGHDCTQRQENIYKLTKKEKQVLENMAWEAPTWRREHLINMMKREVL